MPGGDKTGPRGLGWCRGGFEDRLPTGGFGAPRAIGFGYGRGRGRRHWAYATGLPGWARSGRGWFGGMGTSQWTPQDELNYLREYTQGLEEALNASRMRISEIEKAQQGQ